MNAGLNAIRAEAAERCQARPGASHRAQQVVPQSPSDDL